MGRSLVICFENAERGPGRQGRDLLDRVLRLGVYAFQAMGRSFWLFPRPPTLGVHGIPLTPDGKVVLVTLRYAQGWRLPGGGRKSDEDPRVAILRELKEEIGLIAHRSIEPVCDLLRRPVSRHGEDTLFVIRGVQYRPSWSLEVKEVAEFSLGALPGGTAAVTHKLLGLAKAQLA